MKKLVFSIVLLSATVFTYAQKTNGFKPFKVDLASGYALPSGSGSKAGVILAVEPKYSVNDQITLGLRFEGALTARAAISADGETMSGDVKASASYLATADYFFTANKFRPFAGAGAGLYRLAAVEVESEEGTVEADSKFGFAPRAGFEYGHFRMAVEYNVAGKTGSINNNYIGFKLGFFIGGGRIKAAE